MGDTSGQRASSACRAEGDEGGNYGGGNSGGKGFERHGRRTSGEGGFMMMLHASDTDREADLWRFSLFARFGWWARICERAGCGRGEGLVRRVRLPPERRGRKRER